MNPFSSPISGDPKATITLSGDVKLATDGETVTGTSDEVVTTPGNITAKMSAPGAIGNTTPSSGAFTTVSASGVITSTQATGTAPFTITSTTKVTNLNVDQLDGADWAAPAAIGSGTPAAGTFTVLQGELNVIPLAASTVLTTAQCKGSVVVVTGAYTMTLPIVTGFEGSIGGSVVVYSAGADTIHVDANASDRIVLDGTALDDGDKITSPGTAGAYVYLVNDTAAGWRVMGRYGIWTDGGA